MKSLIRHKKNIVCFESPIFPFFPAVLSPLGTESGPERRDLQATAISHLREEQDQIQIWVRLTFNWTTIST